MADVSIKYKDNVIAEMNESESKTLNTSGCYCEGDITVEHAPRSRSYKITLPKSIDWVLLTTLDQDVIEHIEDDSLVVTFINTDDYEFDGTAARRACYATNTAIGLYANKYPVYGNHIWQSTETAVANQSCYYPAKNTAKTLSIGGVGGFRYEDGKYYVSGFQAGISAGTWQLTFTW